ncbi:hypothetical protein TELCIR_12711 [Teladorsagia circumcincta]|uniref:Uncharacterized protein n=1 Tax=Teladorsagia circumcincta TaxID=45464 RepID=A0A2G9U5T4_TELCI|nr:hypothetical protein TELCIR_12711 [Teladorsagia circumcincta]
MSNFSPYANVKCEAQPSTSTANETSLPLSSPCHPSPALARSVPSSQEATSPSETAGKDFVFFTTELANQAALDFEKERFDSLLEWHIKYRKRKEAERSADDAVSEKASSSVSAESTPVETSERKPEKRKAESDPEDQVAKKPTYMDLNAPDVSTKKAEETPLRFGGFRLCTPFLFDDEIYKKFSRRMEMMTNSSAFSTSSSINDVVEAPANGLCKKDERSVKLEKLGEMERQVEAERLRVEWEKEVQAHEVCIFLWLLYCKLFWLGFVRIQMKKLMNNQGLSPYPSPMYPRALPPASAGMQSPVPGPGYPGDPSRMGFPMPGHSPSASPFYPGPFPPHPYAQMPYGHPGMSKGMVPPPPYPFPPGGMMPAGPGMPSNPGMMRGDAMAWQGGAPPNYPPSFPTVPGGPTPPIPCQHLTPPKQGLAV